MPLETTAAPAAAPTATRPRAAAVALALASFRGSVQPRSGNAKTGPMVTTYSAPATCPTTCPLYGAPRPDGRADAKSPCYAAAGFHTRTAWNRLADGSRGLTWSAYLEAIRAADGPRVRVNVAGDLPHLPGGDIIAPAVIALARAASRDGSRVAFGYTHHARTPRNLRIIRAAAAHGLTVNVSTDGAADAFATMAAHPGVPVVATMPADMPAVVREPDTGRRIIQCPATREGSGVTCDTCGGGTPLCARPVRDYAVGFPVHGTQYKRAALALAMVTAAAAGVKS
jgi:hypothetical protein